jgi:hypothetical protein
VDAVCCFPSTFLAKITLPALNRVSLNSEGARRRNILGTPLADAQLSIQLATVLAIFKGAVAMLAQISSPASITGLTHAFLNIESAAVFAVNLRARAFLAQSAFPRKIAMCAFALSEVECGVQLSIVDAGTTRCTGVVDVTNPFTMGAISSEILTLALTAVHHTITSVSRGAVFGTILFLHTERTLWVKPTVNWAGHVHAFAVPRRTLVDALSIVVATVSTLERNVGARVDL